eukprot:TRINITY_DN3132_c0_g1_i1.p1 TRINITY_DN3132_c0_g1~~TRINITY_DN3132_c0_g1_i1.p1  ORF type:complete len:192 (-),score=38.85 TRINITY_DN3132_c0_g1_i1:104-679(-)
MTGSRLSLGAWTQELTRRVEFLRSWVDFGPPVVYWLPAFSFPQGFVTAALQARARATATPIDELKLACAAVQGPADGSGLTTPPSTGMYVCGLQLEGAVWDAAAGTLADAPAGTLSSPLPVLHLYPVSISEPDPPATSAYSCPVYRTASRAGALNTTGISSNYITSLYLSSSKPASHWVMRGVAALCQPAE